MSILFGIIEEDLVIGETTGDQRMKIFLTEDSIKITKFLRAVKREEITTVWNFLVIIDVDFTCDETTISILASKAD